MARRAAAASHLSDGSLKHLFRALVPLGPGIWASSRSITGNWPFEQQRRPSPAGASFRGGVWARGVQLGGHRTTSVRTGVQTSWSWSWDQESWNDPAVPTFLWGGGAGTHPKPRLPLLIRSASFGVCENNSGVIKSRATAAKTGEHRLELLRNKMFRRTPRLLFSL